MRGRPLSRPRWRLLVTVVAGGAALLVAANTHLVYVALVSQPDCVPHAKLPGDGGGFHAARSVC